MKQLGLIILIIILSSCSKNAFEQFEKGDIKSAYSTLLKKAKKQKLERNELKLFKKVISEVVSEDSISYHRMLSYENLDNNIRAYEMYDDMKERNDELSKLRYNLPGYSFVNAENHDDLSKKILDSYFEDANILMISAEEDDDKQAARKAYELYDEMKNYHTHKDYPIKNKMREAEDLGKEYVLVSYATKTFGYDWEIERNMDMNLYNSTWKEYHEEIDLKVEYDIIAEVIVDDARFDDRLDTRTRNYSERIITGYNTEVDTSGVKTETPIYETVNATLYTDRIQRILYVSGEVEIRSRDGARYDRDIREEYSEDAEQYRYTGDIRALPSNVQNLLNQTPGFSNESRFYEEVMDDFMDEARDIIEDI